MLTELGRANVFWVYHRDDAASLPAPRPKERSSLMLRIGADAPKQRQG
jgi:hypothetical protein